MIGARFVVLLTLLALRLFGRLRRAVVVSFGFLAMVGLWKAVVLFRGVGTATLDRGRWFLLG